MAGVVGRKPGKLVGRGGVSVPEVDLGKDVDSVESYGPIGSTVFELFGEKKHRELEVRNHLSGGELTWVVYGGGVRPAGTKASRTAVKKVNQEGRYIAHYHCVFPCGISSAVPYFYFTKALDAFSAGGKKILYVWEGLWIEEGEGQRWRLPRQRVSHARLAGLLARETPSRLFRLPPTLRSAGQRRATCGCGDSRTGV